VPRRAGREDADVTPETLETLEDEPQAHPGAAGALAAFSAAAGTVGRLLSGPAGWRRWRELAVLAAMAGIVGVGVQPPPLGLLQPVLDDPLRRRDLLAALAPYAPLLVFLALLLLLIAPVARAFTLGFVHGIATGEPRRGDYRRFLGPGARHFLWSGALTLPLYALLFWGEWRVVGEGWERLLNAPDEQAAAVLLTATGKFLLVLGPWVVLTLPLMVAMYELTPAAMVAAGTGPAGGFRRVLAVARKRPGATALYFGLRLALQFFGTTLAAIALLPALLLSLVPGLPLLGGGWALSAALGGVGTGAGAAAASVGLLLYLAVLYCLVCAFLVPLSAFLYAWAWHFLQVEPGPAAT
jgi:hypothetical protein